MISWFEAYVVITLTRVLVFRKYGLECLGAVEYHSYSLLLSGSEKDQWPYICVHVGLESREQRC